MKDFGMIKKEDYEEPACLLCSPDTGAPKAAKGIPLRRIAERVDEMCARKDFDGTERHLKYWREEARALGDIRGLFSLENEMMGFYRKQGMREEAEKCAASALELMERLEYENSVSGATCLINCGTVYDNFGQPEKAIDYFERAEKILESIPHKDIFKQGSLYNNMALALADLGRRSEAREYFFKALETMKQFKGGELEQAVTYLNLADNAAMDKGLEAAGEEIADYVNKAKALIDTESLPRDGYYAFVCEKCAPGFYCYGFDEFGEEIEDRAENIYKEIKENDHEGA